MTRTKKPVKTADPTSGLGKEIINDETIQYWLEQYNDLISKQLTANCDKYETVVHDIKKRFKLKKLEFKPEYGNKTLEELSLDELPNVFEDMSHVLEKSLSILNSTKKKKPNLKKTKKKISDEGYITTESTRTHSCDRINRSRSSSRDSRRKSRSLSRSKMQKTITIQLPPGHDDKRTPPDKRMPPPASSGYGFVTPKVKPNTPLTVLRRPKQGELAISMQGSPLLISGVITETCANINIPLEDGRIVSIQPNNNLRMSQFPIIADSTREQLLTLRDNLNKMCEHSIKK